VTLRAFSHTFFVGLRFLLHLTNARFELIERWNILPDFAGVNFHESDVVKIARLLLDKGVGVDGERMVSPVLCKMKGSHMRSWMSGDEMVSSAYC
jgi:hypothetical protein